MPKRRTPLALFAQDYQLEETALNIEWINGKPIFQQVILIPGSNDQSTITIAALIGHIDTLLPTSSWSTFFNNLNHLSNRSVTGDSGIVIVNVNGQIVIFHQGVNLTGNTLNVILEYTKL